MHRILLRLASTAAEPAPPRRRRVARAVRRGFTLTELLVALLLLDVGVLALVASGAAVVRELGAGISQTIAIEAARNRLERLASLRCPIDTSGADAIAPHARAWWTAATHAGIRELADSAEWLERGRVRTIVMRTRLPC